ncbi:Mitochondrial import receptor subunit tom20 [Pseudocercospora fuligena]|uniref:Mitochondrial import receptor subunit TOM20 n=1 Tax=Pseudocercospora fuligena TaxID=685502 RepID=A0A8H6RK51_9PEZI|nr:Mitochondrial import receptor subunit tom20 [Pseudocercospora fuligena]
MASTVPSSGPSIVTIAVAAAGVVTAGALAYAVYFDHRRRSDPEFRKYLKKQHKKVHKSNVEASKAAENAQKQKIRAVVDEANEDGFPRDPEETEAYFMQEVARGESMCTDGSDPVDAALCFYKALKVYPQPRELISIYDKTVPKPILDILAEMIAVDPSISVTGSSGGSDAGSDKVE